VKLGAGPLRVAEPEPVFEAQAETRRAAIAKIIGAKSERIVAPNLPECGGLIKIFSMINAILPGQLNVHRETRKTPTPALPRRTRGGGKLGNATILMILLVAVRLSSAVTTAPSDTSDIPPSGTTAGDALKASPRHGEWVDVSLPGSHTKLHTWVVYPERGDKAPVVLVIHEIFGMSDWVRGVADQVAAEGYIAVAPDMLSGMGPNGGGTESLGDQVGRTIGKFTADEEFKRLDAALDYGLSLPAASDKCACVGFCWGGGVSFNYATHQSKLGAAIVFYGSPPKKDAMANIPCPVLGLYGGDDGRISLTVPDTIKAMGALNKSYSPHIYDGAGHGFLRQQQGRNGANLKAAEQGWGEVRAFLKRNLATTQP
jgi:carboxymethylenebutenolidase